jgi:uncharacterized protein YecE (DUF72 family)
MSVVIGCSGWNYDDWRGRVYHGGPAGWLSQYAERFESVEVNATFYRLPSRETVERWRDATPDRFCFAVKASRYLTHVRKLKAIRSGAHRLLERLQPLHESGKLGPLLWQLPETFHRDDVVLGRTLADLPAGRHCFEFRHPSWFCDPVYRLLSEFDAALVFGDHPARPFQAFRFPTHWTYVRFHHGRRGRNGNYSATELQEWARRLRRWSRRGDVYAFFNNDWNAYAPRNASRLRSLTAG